MKVAVLGTGTVGRTLAVKLFSSGHEVAMGTRDVAETLAREDPDQMGNPAFPEWVAEHPGIPVTTFADATSTAELVVNATNGSASVEALESAGEANLNGKVLVDVANPLDFSGGMPPTLIVSNTDSLGEQIQRRFPEARVVKTLNTMSASVMVDPGNVGDGNHTIFVSGNDPDAKKVVARILRDWGWTDVLDLGDISTARGTEMYLPLWLRLWGVTQTPVFNVKVVR